MKKISLTERNEEIFNQLPEKYAETIMNAVIARSIGNGLMFNELSLYIPSVDLQKFKEYFVDTSIVLKAKDIVEREPKKMIKEKMSERKELEKMEEKKSKDIFVV